MVKLTEEELIQKVDQFYKDDAVEQGHELISQYRDSPNPQVIWRVARSCRYMVRRTKDAEEKKKLSYEVRDYGKRALDQDENCSACHKWYAIGLNLVGELEGPKEKLKNAFLIRDHFQKAKDLDPSDPMPCFLLGMWCFSCADMPWLHRKIASALFGTPPTSTYEEAVQNFEDGEKVQANFYGKNLMMLGKAHSRLKNKEKAKEWLNKALEYPGKKLDDEDAKKEAKELLKLL